MGISCEFDKWINKSHRQQLATHTAEQRARKPNARRHGSNPNGGSNEKEYKK